MLLILAYAVIVHTMGMYTSSSLDSLHGLYGIMLYWHFVDAVWISVIILVYGGQLAITVIAMPSLIMYTSRIPVM